MSIEAMKLALEALEDARKYVQRTGGESTYGETVVVLRQAIAEAELVKSAEEAYEAAKKHGWVGVSDERLMEMPEFTKHIVESTTDWSEWVCPDPESYLMKCCDCGLVHEAQFGVVRYKSETEREDCDKVDDPNLQAVFRMRRHEEWEPEDTAHRAGGLPMEQAQPVAVWELQESGWDTIADAEWMETLPIGTKLYTAPPQRKPLSDEVITTIVREAAKGSAIRRDGSTSHRIARAIEAAHGIKENT